MRQSKHRNTIVDQDQRAVKRVMKPMLGVKSFWAARCIIAGIEVRHAIRKGYLVNTGKKYQPPAEQFYSLAA
jgi:transposase-like protein